jgi:hypothetical protein
MLVNLFDLIWVLLEIAFHGIVKLIKYFSVKNILEFLNSKFKEVKII